MADIHDIGLVRAGFEIYPRIVVAVEQGLPVLIDFAWTSLSE